MLPVEVSPVLPIEVSPVLPVEVSPVLPVMVTEKTAVFSISLVNPVKPVPFRLIEAVREMEMVLPSVTSPLPVVTSLGLAKISASLGSSCILSATVAKSFALATVVEIA